MLQREPFELATLSWIGEQYAARLDVIRAMLGRYPNVSIPDAFIPDVQNDLLSESATLRLVDAWRRAGLVRTRQFLHSELPWVWLTTRGLREVNLPFVSIVPRASALTRMHTINWLRWYAENTYAGLQWQSKRSLRVSDEGTRLPDAAILKPHDTRDRQAPMRDLTIALIVQMSGRSEKWLVDKLHDFASSYDRLWIAIDSQANLGLKSILNDAVNRSGLREVISIYDVRADRFPHFAR